MNLSEEKIRLIFGLKLRQMRMDKNLSLQELAEKSGLSVSYINEIEKGKKYPKTDKIALLSNALEVPYDQMVSLKLSKQLAPLADILYSGFLDEIPLELFGIDSQKIIEMVAAAPAKVSAFISTLIEIARNYNMNKEHFYSAALRSYQELHENYFDEIEKDAYRFFKDFDIAENKALTYEQLKLILENHFNCIIDEEELSKYPLLVSFRSLFKSGNPHKLLLNKELSNKQKCFILAKEIGYHYLKLPLEQRTYLYKDWVNTQSFEHAFINFKASYFAGAILLPEKAMVGEIGNFFELEEFSEVYLLNLMKKWESTPETLMYRFTNLIPKHFGIHNLFFLRFNNSKDTESYYLSKELHLNRQHNPHANENGEHYCRRWMALKIFQKLRENNGKTVVGVQKSSYVNTQNEYLILTLARQTLRKPQSNISISVGMQYNAELKRKIKWVQDEKIPQVTVNVTCQRCSLIDCTDRAAPATIYTRAQEVEQIKSLIKKITT